MERTLLLLALSSLVAFSTAQQDLASTYVRPHRMLGSGQVTCALVPIPGVTLTAECKDGINPSKTITAVTDVDGLFSFKYFTDYPEFRMDARAATCVLQSLQPAVISKNMTCGGITQGSCSINMAPTRMAADMAVTYTAAPAGCTPKVEVAKNEPFRSGRNPCPKTRYQIVGTSERVYSVQDRTIPIDVSAGSDEDTCANACMATQDCAHYSFNCKSCTLYKRGAIAMDSKLLVTENYDITSGVFICPTNIGTCR